MADGIIELLSRAGGYLSGQEIASSLGISRNAVWKAVQKARDEGFEIEAAPRRGYKLIGSEEAFGREGRTQV